MKTQILIKLSLIAVSATLLGGCGDSESEEWPKQAGKFTILGIKTDEADPTTALKNAQNTLKKFPDIDAMVGLWAYNAPACLEAVKDADKLGKIKIFSFDEDKVTLQGIRDGEMEGTVVQNPYEFGYKSVEYLKMINDGKESEIPLPANKQIFVEAKLITKDNVEAHAKQLAEYERMGKEAANAPVPDTDESYAFVINNDDPFWSFARYACAVAQQDFKVKVEFRIPGGGKVEEQDKILRNIVKKGNYNGVAVSPLDSKNQTPVLDEVAGKLPLICHDSDASKSKRRFYIGTDNVEAGRMLARLVKERMPNGGKIMVFVGKMDVVNAQERSSGLIEELGKE